MAARVEKTRHSGTYRRGSRYVTVWGRQHEQAFRTLTDA